MVYDGEKLSRIDINYPTVPLRLQTYWCRIVRTCSENWFPKAHSHTYWELHLCLQGKCEILIDEQTFCLSAWTFLFLPPGKQHKILHESNDFSKFIWSFEVSDDTAQQMLQQTYAVPAIRSVGSEMQQAFAMLMHHVESERYGSFELIKNDLYHIFVLLTWEAEGVPYTVPRKQPVKELALIRAYLQENPQSSIDDVVSLFGVSKTSLDRMCNKELHMSFYRMKQELLLERIRTLLCETNLSMEQIAEATGFSDRYAMGKFFKRQEGTPPGNFRKATRR